MFDDENVKIEYFINMLKNNLNRVAEKQEENKVDRISREENNGVGVSTLWVDDLNCYETALLDSNGAHPVERYDELEKAKEGHQKWLEFSKNCEGKVVVKLGLDKFGVDDEEIQIQPGFTEEIEPVESKQQ